MDLLFSLAPYAIGLFVLYIGWNAVAARLTIRVPVVTLDDVAAKLLGDRYRVAKVERQAAREIKSGNYLMAGKIYEDAGMPQRALQAYLDGEELMAAGFVLEGMPGKTEKAAECFLKAGDYKKAADLYTKAGKPGRAAPLFEERGNNLEAARLYGLAQQWDKAAALFTKSGYSMRAGEAYEKQGSFLNAALSYEKHFLENVTFSTTYSSAPPAAEMKTAWKAGQLFEQAGEPERAREIYVRGAFFKEAAAVSLALGQFEKAAELLLRAEDLAAAADAYEKGGDHVKAAGYRGEVAFKAGRLAEAAAFFEQGQDYQRAAELFEEVGMLAEAAAAYEAGGSPSSAGHVHLRAGRKDRAAACFASGGEHETAAALYREIGEAAKAAELYKTAGLGVASQESGVPGSAAAAGARPQPATGAPAARFALKEEIGRGPLGVVHRGEDLADNGKPVAMRVLPPAATPHISTLMADLKAAAAVGHPHLVRLLGAVDVEGRRTVVTELIQGATLAPTVAAGRRLPPAQVQGIARALVQALLVLHGKGLAHGSLQPSNVMSAGGVVKLADLGLGRLHLALAPGTPYRAPEARLDAAADVYSLGALLQRLLAGESPAGAAAGLPAPFDALVPRCLAAQPSARPPVREIASLLGARS